MPRAERTMERLPQHSDPTSHASLGHGHGHGHASASAHHDLFPPPIRNMPDGNGFDFHIYFLQNNHRSVKSIKALHGSFRRAFPLTRMYPIQARPGGPHTAGMFEVNACTPAELGAVFAWLVVNRGEHSVLIHPHVGNAVKEHTALATWMGQPFPIDTEMLESFEDAMSRGTSRADLVKMREERQYELNAALESLRIE
ncbi:hypothetical protein SeMB42_g02875 [Synchytrium endobioticum]|uniref:DOPA 4,5-dioxygenase n=1 Tax=Synchytrium endobioticum TaxID=286115 RepID=A0A507CNS0_9FUNG|nr:hypothetical protein SeLEV6574_g06421 [Synchytrium endobioticum]TPX48725.1 hypothetical protein SeMB42_g02875 [Synchytrium endobioticum]